MYIHMMCAMWRTLIFTLAAPLSISNIELLIPLAVSRAKDREVDRVDSNEDQEIDRDEPFSSIPAYSFMLDTDPMSVASRADQSSTNFPSRAQPELIPSRSWYLSNIRQRPQDTERNKQGPHKRSEKQVERLKEEKRNGCRALANQHNAEARAVLLYLCTELVDLLTSRCDCCEEEQHPKKSRSIVTMPWFGTIGNHRRNQKVLEDDDQENRLGSRVSV